MAFVIGFCAVPCLKALSGEYVTSLFFYAPTEIGIVNPNSPGHVLLFSHIRGGTSMAALRGKVEHPRSHHGMKWHIYGRTTGRDGISIALPWDEVAMPRGSPRGQFGVRPLTQSQATNPSQPSSGTTLKKGGEIIPKSSRHKGQRLLSGK